VGGKAIDVPGFDENVVAPRTRGRPARISRERIIAAARTIAPEALTMQKVADVLGVAVAATDQRSASEAVSV